MNLGYLFFHLLLVLVGNANGFRICIVGAGPSGLLFLQRLVANNLPVDVDVSLIESRSNPQYADESNMYSISVADNSLKFCEEYSEGLSSFIISNACKSRSSIKFLSANPAKSRIAKNFSYFTTHRAFCLALIKWVKEKNESKKLDSSKTSIDLMFNSKCLSIDPTEGLVYFQKENDPNIIKGKFDLIIGADGANSVVRQSVLSDRNGGITYESQPYPTIWKSMQFKLASELENSTSIIGRDKSMSYLTTALPNGNMCLTMWWIPKKKEEMKNPRSLNTPEAVKTLMERMFQDIPIADNLEEKSKEFFNKRTAKVSYLKVNKFHHSGGKVVIMGDAAHNMIPFLAQGMASSLRDANCLFKHLQDSQWTNIPSALEKYSEESVPEARAIIDLNFLAYASPLFFIIDLLRFKIFRQPNIFLQTAAGKCTYQQLAKNYKFWIKGAKKGYQKTLAKFEKFAFK